MISADEAQLLLHQGKVTDAERAFAAILEREPDNTQALNVMALRALRMQDLKTALSHIEHALRMEADNPLTLYNRGRILEAAERYVDAAASHRAALKLVPNLHTARLYLGRALELAGRRHHAIVAYARALEDAQKDGRWLSPATTPAVFQPLIQHAVQQVRLGRRTAIEELLQPVVAQFGRDSMTRVDKSLRIYFNEEAAAVSDPRQRSTFLHFPDIPANPYVDLKLFPWIDWFEAEAPVIRDELLSLLPSGAGREPVFGNAALEAAHLRGLNCPPTWNGYYFYRHGERRNENCDRCRRTAAALEALPLCKIREHGPEVLFSVFTPGTHLLPHRGVTNTRVVAHLPLMVPDDCALVVGGEAHRWREGKVVVFDDTYEHEAWNRSAKTRVVLIFDLWSPYLTEAERSALAILIGDISDFRHEVEAGV
ncbi:MAG: aspartyl/asparaginyl beta-hydroxylase domain-containing protein [Pseudomonadota bacterium]|nr:aspartyl/asparaginyl beta-hydroxylase domain-containing protein [Pseudomonadota bacterium]